MSEEFKRRLAEMEDFDEKFIENKPWAMRLLTTSQQMTRKAVLNWCNIIVKIGESDVDVDNYVSIYLTQIENLYEELIADVETIQEKSLDKIMKLLQQIENLCKDLHLEIPTFNYEGIPLCELYSQVLRKVEEYEALTETRRRELTELHQKMTKLCKSLGREATYLQESPLPLPKDVDDLRARVELLENEAMEREEKFFQMKTEIAEIVEELGIPPSLDFERELLDMTDTEVKIGDLDMEQLHTYHDYLSKKSTVVKEDIASLRIKIDDLWKKLEIDIAEQDRFRALNTGNSLKTLDALKIELQRLEDIKKANMMMFIMKQRDELKELWAQCHRVQDEEKQRFSFFFSDCYTEDLFELHDREIQHWKYYYEENKELLLLIEEYKKLWTEHRGLELNSGGANRYKNRGGQLLIEEKLRNRFKKRIPKIEESLLKLAQGFMERNGKEFFTYGLTIAQYIEKLHNDTDKEIKEQLSAKKQQREHLSTLTSSARKNQNPTLTPRPGPSKRKIMATPVTEPAKKPKPSKTKTGSKTGLPKVNVSLTRRRRSNRARQKLSFTSSNKENDQTASSYDVFEKEVSMKDGCRSTAFGVKVLGVRQN